MSVAVYEQSLQTGRPAVVRYGDGSTATLDVARWSGPARGADDSLLARVTGPALDIGCGPGRLVAALAAQGIPALGIDIAPAAVGLTRRAGGRALQLSVFDDVPDAGRWGCAVLADGNIGIGGDPVRLLRRAADLLAPAGRVLVELAAPHSGARTVRVRLEDPAGTSAGAWFPWAHVAADAIAPLAAQAELRVVEEWCEPADGDPVRWFAALVRT
ncbi:MAG: methyltransferase type 11 [Frankiales bacterium]|jgi:SAM-dependent methyltransferase|nr:methyltransferase type 11 [Frankiales bacterium]